MVTFSFFKINFIGNLFQIVINQVGEEREVNKSNRRIKPNQSNMCSECIIFKWIERNCSTWKWSFLLLFFFYAFAGKPKVVAFWHLEWIRNQLGYGLLSTRMFINSFIFVSTLLSKLYTIFIDFENWFNSFFWNKYIKISSIENNMNNFTIYTMFNLLKRYNMHLYYHYHHHHHCH